MICVIDYGMGNLYSVSNALETLKIPYVISDKKEVIQQASGLILPGVGAFKDCMDTLKRKGLDKIIKEEVKKGKLLLGICLGMQVLFEKGYEVEECEGLSFLKGNIVLMKDSNVKIPHMGWNRLERKEEYIMNQFNKDVFVYFVHSYYAQDYNEEDIKAYALYGTLKIPAYVQKDNIYGMQFHPEKSGEEGLKMLMSFASLCK